MKRTEKGELSVAVESFEMLTKSLLPLPRQVQGPDGRRDEVSPAVRRPHRLTRGARHLPHQSGDRQRHPTFPRRPRVHGDGDPRAGVPRRRRRRAKPFNTFHNAVGHGSHPPHRHRAPPQATRRRRFRARVRARSHLPQRGHLHATQPGVHVRGGVPGVRGRVRHARAHRGDDLPSGGARVRADSSFLTATRRSTSARALGDARP